MIRRSTRYLVSGPPGDRIADRSFRTGLAGGDSRRLRVGTRFEMSGAALAVELAGEHRDGGAAGPEHALRLDGRLRF